MTADEIFAMYYTIYRAQAEVPANTDDEYTIFLVFAKEAIKRWENYDATYWKELFTTLSQSGETITISSGVTQYEMPDDFKEAGGYLRIIGHDGNTVMRIPVVEPQDAQFRSDNSSYCFQTGDASSGYVLNINPAPASNIVGLTGDMVYYKHATLFTTGGKETTEMPAPTFIVHRALAQRFRSSRNPYYGDAKTDAEDVLKTMQAQNNSGNWADPWSLQDHSGTQFGG